MRRNRDCANSLEAKDATPANTYVMVLCGILSFAYLLGEHHVRNVGVRGSNPLCSTKKLEAAGIVCRFFYAVSAC